MLRLLVPPTIIKAYLGGRDLSSLTLMDRPMRVAMLQWGMVGVKRMETALLELSTFVGKRKIKILPRFLLSINH
jgi:hypothetical protein